jgi:hypothetical protein
MGIDPTGGTAFLRCAGSPCAFRPRSCVRHCAGFPDAPRITVRLLNLMQHAGSTKCTDAILALYRAEPRSDYALHALHALKGIASPAHRSELRKLLSAPFVSNAFEAAVIDVVGLPLLTRDELTLSFRRVEIEARHSAARCRVLSKDLPEKAISRWRSD